jgi:hypothetical protein
MEWTPEKLAKVRALISEDSAVLVQKGAVAFGTGTAGARRIRQKIVRQWPRINDGDRALCEAYLLEYASAANTTPGNIVHGPKTDRETFTGDWRMTRTDLSRIKTDSREQGCYQTLIFPADASDGPDGSFPSEETHLNHVHTTVSTGSAPAEIPCEVPPQGTRLSAAARLDKETGEWESEVRTDQARKQEWQYTDGDALSTTTHKRAEHASAPPAAATPAPGKIVRSHAEMDDYGTYRTQVDETTAHEKTTGPYTASQNALQSTTEESVRNAQSAPDAGDNESVNARLNEFGLVDFNKTKTTPKPGEAQAEAAEWTEKTTSLAYRNADAPKNAIDGVTDPHAIVPSATAHKNEFGKYDGSVQVAVPVEQRSGPYTVEQNALRKVESTFHFNKEPGSVPAASTSRGVAITIQTRVNRFGLLDIEERKTSAGTSGTNAWKRINAAEWWTETVYTMEFRNWDDVPHKADFGAREPLASFGVLSNHNVNFNDIGLFDGYIILTVPVEQQTDEVVIEDTDLRRVTVQNFFNKQSAPADATSSDGTVTTYHPQMNRFGLWDYEKRTTTYKAKDGTEYISEDTDQHTTKVQQKFNQAAPEESVNTTGAVQSVTNRLNEAGRYDTEKRTTTYNPVTGTQYTSEDAFFESTQTQQKFNQNAPENAQKTTGTVQTVTNRLNEAGRYDTEKRTETAAAQSSSKIKIEDSAERTVEIQHFYNQASPPSGATHNASTHKDTSYSGVQINRFGLYDYTLVETTGKGKYGFSSGSVTWTVPVGRGHGVYATTTISRQGSSNPDHRWTETLYTWAEWTLSDLHTITACNSYSAAAAILAALSPSLLQVVTEAHIEDGGNGIWYAVSVVRTKSWIVPQ